MCGIAGFIGRDDAAHALASRMADALFHRGPDDGGAVRIATHGTTSGPPTPHASQTSTTSHASHASQTSPASHASHAQCGAIAARRLAIRDTSDAGHQPMVSRDGRFTIVYNGEVYNAGALRAQLAVDGATFRGHSDTEVILNGWAQYGSSIVPKLRGMFAFCIWDATSGAAYLCRDSFGIKPLYFAAFDDAVIFASEVRALLATGRVPHTLNEHALAGYLATGSVPEPDTLLRDVFMLPAGCIATIAIDPASAATTVEVESFVMHPLLGGGPGPVDCDAAARAVHTALADSVEQHLVSDVPLGIFLSGGIDSAALVALTAETGRNPETFTVCFEQKQFDEATIAGAVAKRFGTKHHPIMLRGSDVLAMLPAFFRASDQPSVDGLNTFCIADAVHARDITVALSGIGGDEMFAGYPSFRRAQQLRHLPNHRGILKRLAGRVAGADETKRAQISEMLAGDDPALAAYLASRMMFTPQQVAHLMHAGQNTAAALAGITDAGTFPIGARSGVHPGDAQRIGFHPGDAHRSGVHHADAHQSGVHHADAHRVGAKRSGRRLLNRVSLLELTYYTRNTLLRDADVFTMAHSLELRVPFIDPVVAQAAGAASDHCKLAPRRAKPLLLRALGDRIHESVWRRPKQGFVLPLEHWLQHELRAEVTATLSSRTLVDAGLRAPYLREVWNAFEKKPSSRTTSRVWTLFALAQWLDHNHVTRA